MQALEAAGPCARAGDAEVELGSQGALLVVRAAEAGGERRVLGGGAAPAVDPAGRLQPRDGGDEVRARQPEHGGERIPLVVERPLLGDRRQPERAADDDTTEGAGLAPELERYGCAVIGHRRRG